MGMRGSIGLTLVSFVLLAGCSGSAGASQPTVAPAAENTTVAMVKSYRFDPATIRVPVGTAVTWTNQDNFTHDVRIIGADGWHSQPLRPGESVTHTFSQPGEYAYECTFHSQNMKGKVVVEPR